MMSPTSVRCPADEHRDMRKFKREATASAEAVPAKLYAVAKRSGVYWRTGCAEAERENLRNVERLLVETGKRVDLQTELRQANHRYEEMVKALNLRYEGMVNAFNRLRERNVDLESGRLEDLQAELRASNLRYEELDLRYEELENTFNGKRARVVAVAGGTPHAPTRCDLKAIFPEADWDEETIVIDVEDQDSDAPVPDTPV
jgi:hypothetical protein